MSQISTVRDASGIRECSYDSYGHMTKTLPLEPWKAPFRNNNALGRPAGYRLLLGTRTVQHSHLDYDYKGGMIGMNLEGLKSSFTWRYDPTSGFLNRLTYPNGMVRCNTYHPALNLVTAIGYRKGADGESATGHEYDYDALMRPIQRRDLWDAATPATIRDFTYNSRSELLEDRISRGGSFAYCYDNIGNRKTARELEKEVAYESNRLNQYADIAGGEEDFTPVYDADGNQTRIRTSTGIWEVSYDANDRPVVFTSQDGRTSITCGYDYRGRRFEKKVTVNGAVSSHSRFLYRDYLQVAELDLTHPEPLLVKSYLWDPTDPTATRILMMTCWQENGMKVKEHLYFMHDALKNVTSIFDGQQTRRARYEYAPFGSLLTAKEDMAQENKFRFSCEYADDELGLVYYNYRHLNPADGRWINRDPIQEQGGWNLYAFIRNRINIEVDLLGTIPPYNGGASGIVEVPIPQPSIIESNEITLNYIAYPGKQKEKDKGLEEVKKRLERKGPVYETFSPDDFNPSEHCCCGKCVKKLLIVMHGTDMSYGTNQNVRAEWREAGLMETRTRQQISDVFKNVKIPFCEKCEVELRSCYLGQNDALRTSLQSMFPCEIVLYGTPVFGYGLIYGFQYLYQKLFN